MSGHLAIVLPGRGYGALGPAIRLPRLAVEQSGARVVEIEYPAVPDDDDPESWARLYASASEQVGAAISAARPSRVTFIAKSLGTIVLANMALAVPVPAAAVWLTPIFGRADVRDGAVARGFPSLLVAGEADTFHSPARHEEVASAVQARSLILPRADHLLEVPGDVMATVDGFRLLSETVLSFAR